MNRALSPHVTPSHCLPLVIRRSSARSTAPMIRRRTTAGKASSSFSTGLLHQRLLEPRNALHAMFGRLEDCHVGAIPHTEHENLHWFRHTIKVLEIRKRRSQAGNPAPANFRFCVTKYDQSWVTANPVSANSHLGGGRPCLAKSHKRSS